MQLSVKLEGGEELSTALQRIAGVNADLRPAWAEFYRPAFSQYSQEWWASEGTGATGGKWRPLSRRYAAWKSRRGGGGLMVLTGRLKGAMESSEVFEPEARQATFGATSPGYTNTPRGRIIVYAQAPPMTKAMTEATDQLAAWYGRTWQGGV